MFDAIGAASGCALAACAAGGLELSTNMSAIACDMPVAAPELVESTDALGMVTGVEAAASLAPW